MTLLQIKYTDLYHVDVLIEDVYLVLGPNFSHLRKRDVVHSLHLFFVEHSVGLQK